MGTRQRHGACVGPRDQSTRALLRCRRRPAQTLWSSRTRRRGAPSPMRSWTACGRTLSRGARRRGLGRRTAACGAGAMQRLRRAHGGCCMGVLPLRSQPEEVAPRMRPCAGMPRRVRSSRRAASATMGELGPGQGPGRDGCWLLACWAAYRSACVPPGRRLHHMLPPPTPVPPLEQQEAQGDDGACDAVPRGVLARGGRAEEGERGRRAPRSGRALRLPWGREGALQRRTAAPAMRVERSQPCCSNTRAAALRRPVPFLSGGRGQEHHEREHREGAVARGEAGPAGGQDR
jgi:hypothetical protein